MGKTVNMKGKGITAFVFASVLVFGLMLSAAGCKKSETSSLPSDFNAHGDGHKVAYMMKQASPDSVARFICLAALGKVEGVKIDTLATATLYAYENYRDNDVARFSAAYDSVVESLPLVDKMKLMSMGASEDPQGMGFQLGLEYMGNIRSRNMTADQVEKELKAFRQACANDSDTYRRFIIGFRTVLECDRGKDVPEEIYKRFINFE